MGNHQPTLNPVQQIDNLSSISSQQKQNLKLYLWRSSTETNQHIPRVLLHFPQPSPKTQQRFSCLTTDDNFSPNISFENYVCDFRPIKGYLDLSEMLTVFRAVIKGHERVFRRFGASLVSDKCCFLCHNGEVRVWINPNYYLNQFWAVQNKEFRLGGSSAHEINYQTPRFMNKEEFDFQFVSPIASESNLVMKIVEWMRSFSKKGAESFRFWAHLENFVQGNILNNSNFDRIERFINQYAYEKKIILKANIEEVVKRLISEEIIFKPVGSSKDTQQVKRKISMIESGHEGKFQSKVNLTIDVESNAISILDIKNVTNHQVYTGNQNLSRLLATTLNQDDGNRAMERVKKQENFELQTNTKTSIKQKRHDHRRKLSKSLVHPNLQRTTDSRMKQSNNPIVQSEIYQQTEDWSIKTKAKSFHHCQKASTYLDYSYQYSINLHTGPAGKITEKQSDENASRYAPQTYHQFSQEKNLWISDHIKGPINNERTGSILKTSHAKSFQLSRLRHVKNYEEELTCKKKVSTLFLPERSQLSESYDERQSKQLRFQTFGTNSADEIPPEAGFLFKSFEKEEDRIKTTARMESTKRTVTRVRQNSISNLLDIKQTSKRQIQPLNDLTNQQFDSTKVTRIFINNHSNTSLNKNNQLDQSRNRGQASVLYNVHFADEQVQQNIIRSKRRISVGADPEIEKNYRQLNENGMFLGVHQTSPNERTSRTITRLFSTENRLQTSIGSLSDNSNSFSEEENQSKYTGILTKMGRSVPFRKIPDQTINKILELQKVSSRHINEAMPDFTKKKSIYDHGSNRSMKV